MAWGGLRVWACWWWSGCRMRGGLGHRVLAVVAGSAVNSGWCVEWVDGAEWSVAAAGDSGCVGSAGLGAVGGGCGGGAWDGDSVG